ncbi:GB1/RHD3-type G domain-containing protein [Aphelenchoides bicaudatus]|nr:GB1/RHD3-type G domain-containing protein [Aphelenchoides bicaudatus]
MTSTTNQLPTDSVSTSKDSSPLTPRRATLSALIKLRNKRLLTKNPTPKQRLLATAANSIDHDNTRTQFQPVHDQQMEHRHKVRPVQLFVPSNSNPSALRLNKAALNSVLNRSSLANRKVVVMSVVGAFRKGKSFLLNFFLEYLYILQYSQKEFHRAGNEMEWLHDDTVLEGFHRSSPPKNKHEKPKRDGVGIWLWGEPILIDAANGERYAVVLMDTQGTFDPSAPGYQASVAVFIMSTMLASVQCFNIVETFSDDILQPLKFFADYGKIAAEEAPELGTPFQHLYFLIRDFKQTDNYQYGVESGERYLDKVLQTKEDQTDVSKEVREVLADVFDELSCFLLPHPGQKVADRSSFRGLVKDIKPQFREEVKIMTQTLLNPRALHPKTINGKEVTCKKLVEIIKEYAKIFNEHGSLEPRHVLNANVNLISSEYMIEARNFYNKTMDKMLKNHSRMISDKKLLETHIKLGVKALNIYDRCPKIESGDIRATNLSKLQDSINRELEKYKAKNEEKRVTGCASAMLACGDSPLLGLGLGGAASGAIAATIFSLQVGLVSAGIVAIPIALTGLCGIWVWVTIKPTVRVCLGLEREI